ncbi:MAG: ribonuclease P protein component [Bacteroidia bacterium]
MTPDGTSRSYRLPKQTILRHKRAFEYLFEHGSSFRVGVLKFFYAYDIPEQYVQNSISVGFTAPKRVFKQAWQRNRLKRMMREAYRLEQHTLDISSETIPNPPLAFLIKFQGYYEADYSRIASDMRRGLQELQKRSR